MGPVVQLGVQLLSPLLLPLSFQSCGLAPGQGLTITKPSQFKGVPPVSLFLIIIFRRVSCINELRWELRGEQKGMLQWRGLRWWGKP